MTHIALLGTGLLGEAIGHRLLASGIELGVWNRKPGRCKKLLDAGSDQISNLNEVAENWDALNFISTVECITRYFCRTIGNGYMTIGSIKSKIESHLFLLEMKLISNY